jgi:DNA polymerase elongation subunit (family B)
MDVILLHLLEEKNLDIDMLQRLSEITNTRKEKVFRKTVSLKNFVSKYANDNGYIMNNNQNVKYGYDSEVYEREYMPSTKIVEQNQEYLKAFEHIDNVGGFVLDPNLNLPDNGVVLNGKPSKFLFESVFDVDFSSLYPSIIMAYNLDNTTQVGKFFLNDDHIKDNLVSKHGYDFSTQEDINNEDLGPTFIDSLQSFDVSRIGEKYMDLPSTEDLVAKIEKIKNNR